MDNRSFLLFAQGVSKEFPYPIYPIEEGGGGGEGGGAKPTWLDCLSKAATAWLASSDDGGSTVFNESSSLPADTGTTSLPSPLPLLALSQQLRTRATTASAIALGSNRSNNTSRRRYSLTLNN